MEERPDLEKEQQKSKANGLFRIKAGLFLACSAGIGLLAGFGGAIAAARRQGRHLKCVVFLEGYLSSWVFCT